MRQKTKGDNAFEAAVIVGVVIFVIVAIAVAIVLTWISLIIGFVGLVIWLIYAAIMGLLEPRSLKFPKSPKSPKSPRPDASQPGWKSDPHNPQMVRWWTGHHWGDTRMTGKKLTEMELRAARAREQLSKVSPAAATAQEPPLGPSAAWYADPEGKDQLRWWDGERWTEYVHPTSGDGA